MNHFVKLYLDEDVSVLLGKILVGRGFDALTARDAGMLRKSDEEQLLFATTHSRAILTHNRRHFEKLHLEFVEKQFEHAGIVVAGRRDLYEMARRVALLLHATPARVFRNQLFYILISATGHWRQRRSVQNTEINACGPQITRPFHKQLHVNRLVESGNAIISALRSDRFRRFLGWIDVSAALPPAFCRRRCRESIPAQTTRPFRRASSQTTTRY